MLRKLTLLCLFLLPVFATAQHRPRLLTRDSISRNFGRWLYAPGDHPEWAQPGFDDNDWVAKDARFPLWDTANHFAPVSWFRLHVLVDSTLLNMPLSIEMAQYGASEVYLDGRLIERYGIIGDAAHTVVMDPKGVPLIVYLSPGLHVFAVRYANYTALADYDRYEEGTPGFIFIIDNAKTAVPGSYEIAKIQGMIVFILLGIFAAVGFTHSVLYFYFRADRSNLYFGFFGLLVAIGVLALWFSQMSHNPRMTIRANYVSFIIISAIFWALSAVMNELFSLKKLRFYLISGFALLTAVASLFSDELAAYCMITLIVAVALETLVIVIRALYRRVPGAHIVGVGMLAPVIFILYCAIYLLYSKGHYAINNTTVQGQLLEFFAALSVIAVPLSMSVYLATRFAAINKNLQVKLVEVETLSQKTMEQELEKQRLLETRQEELEREVAARTSEVREQHEALKGEKKKSDDLLLNILPEEIAEELKENGFSKARLYDEVSVLFTDFVNFTGISEQLSPSALVAELDFCFREFDTIITRHNLEKIKTIGDAYLAVSGLPAINPKHAQDTLNAALEIRDFMLQRKAAQHNTFDIRLGVHSGPVVAGIVGVKKFAYDIWGDTVNTAARMEQHSEAGRINISGATYELVKDDFSCTYRGELEARNKGKMSMYFVEGLR